MATVVGGLRSVMILLALVAMILGPVSAYAMPPGNMTASRTVAAHDPAHSSAGDCAHAHGGHGGDGMAVADMPCKGAAGPCMDTNGCRHAACTFAMPVLAMPVTLAPILKLPAEPVAPARLSGREIDPPLDPPRPSS